MHVCVYRLSDASLYSDNYSAPEPSTLKLLSALTAKVPVSSSYFETILYVLLCVCVCACLYSVSELIKRVGCQSHTGAPQIM